MQIYYPLRRNLEGQKITVLRNKYKYMLLYTSLEALTRYLQRVNNTSFQWYTIVDSSLINIAKDRFNKDGEISVRLPISFKCGKCFRLKVEKYVPKVTNFINRTTTWPYYGF